MTEVLHPTLTDRPTNDAEFVALSFMVGYANKATRDGKEMCCARLVGMAHR